MIEEEKVSKNSELEKLQSVTSEETPKEKKIELPPPTVHLVGGASERPFVCTLDTSCPEQTADDISKDYEVNNWVLNHLPFRDETQRENFAKTLVLDQLKKEKEKKRQKSQLDLKKKSKLTRQNSVRTLPSFSSSPKPKTKARHFPKSHGKKTTEK